MSNFNIDNRKTKRSKLLPIKKQEDKPVLILRKQKKNKQRNTNWLTTKK